MQSNNDQNTTPTPKKQWVAPQIEQINKDVVKSGSAPGTEVPSQTSFTPS